MTAAERFARIARYDSWSHYLSLGNIFLVGGVALAIVAGVGYWSGKSKGAELARLEATAIVRAQLADSSKAIEARIDARYQAIAFAEKTTTAARAIQQPARAKLRVVSDTVIQIARLVDTVAVEVPREIVTVIQANDTLIAAQGAQIMLLTAQVRDLTADRDVWKRRALLDEDEIRRSRPSRFGFKSGVVVGAVAILATAGAVR